jgi:hypothetical protein
MKKTEQPREREEGEEERRAYESQVGIFAVVDHSLGTIHCRTHTASNTGE